MKTLEERAEEYAKQYCDGDCDLYGSFCEKSRDKKAFIAGAKSEQNELTRWHDPKVELPETDVEVLVMVHADGHTYDVMRYDKQGWWQKAPGGGWCAPKYTPIGWRHIHEI